MKIEDLELGLVPGTEVDIVKEGNKYVLVINPIDEIKKKCDAVLTRDRGIYVKYFPGLAGYEGCLNKPLH